MYINTNIFPHQAERLWQDMSTSLQGRYSGPYDSDFLDKMTPLLEATFMHPRQKIKSQTMLLWNATFARGAPLAYPDILKWVTTNTDILKCVVKLGYILLYITSQKWLIHRWQKKPLNLWLSTDVVS